MYNDSQNQNIISLWILWYYSETPRNLLIAWRNFIFFNLNYFSIPLLLRTFFSPWRRYRWDYPRGFDIKGYFETFISNLTSRILGAMCRTVLILVGVATLIFTFIFGLIIFCGWLLLPIILLIGLGLSFRILF